MTTNLIEDFGRLFLLDAELMDRRYVLYRQLQDTLDVFWCEPLQRWVCLRYADGKSILRDTRFSSEQMPSVLRFLPNEMRSALDMENPLFRQANKIMMSRDDPDHARLRALVNKAFTPRMVELQRPRIERLARSLLDDLEKRPDPDFIRDFAVPLPMLVIAALIGIPCEDLEQLKRWSDTGADFLGKTTNTSETFFQMAVTASEFNDFLRPYLEERRRVPQEDLLSACIQAEMQGERLSEDELIANMFLLLAAGNETTTNLLGNGLWTLLGHPEQWQLLRQQPDLIEAAVEEILRCEGPSQVTGRMTKTEVEIAGQRIGAGQSVMLLLGAMNRDPAQFAEPDTFLLTRQDNKHLAFGLGPHYCLGAPLARLEAQVALPLVWERYPALRLAEQRAHWRQNPTFLGLECLPVFLG